MARAVWRGAITFGQVFISVRLTPAVHERTLRFHLLSPDGSCRLRQRLVCPTSGEEVDLRDAVRGYEYAEDRYVVVSEEEVERVRPAPVRQISIDRFVALEAIDPVYLDRAYYLEPDAHAGRPYRLLAEVLRQTGRAAVARFVMRQRRHLAAIYSADEGLALQTMHYADEVVAPTRAAREAQEGLRGFDAAPLTAGEVDAGRRLVAALSGRFEPAAYHDEYRDCIDRLIDVKLHGGEMPAGAQELSEPAGPINLLDSLRRSLEALGEPPASGPETKARPDAA